MNEVTANAYTKDGKLIVRNRKQFDRDVSEMEGDLEVVVRKKKRVRSIPINRYWWGVCIALIHARFEELGNTCSKEDVHSFLKHRFHYKEWVDEKTGEVLKLPLSTANMTNSEFLLLIERTKEFAATVIDIYIPDPNEDLQLFETESRQQ